MAPSQDAIVTTRIYFIFGLGNPNLNLYLPLASWEGATPEIFRKTNHNNIQSITKYSWGIFFCKWFSSKQKTEHTHLIKVGFWITGKQKTN